MCRRRASHHPSPTLFYRHSREQPNLRLLFAMDITDVLGQAQQPVAQEPLPKGLATPGQDLGTFRSQYPSSQVRSGSDEVDELEKDFSTGVWRMSRTHGAVKEQTPLTSQFDQPGAKKSRRVARSKKALASGAAPLQRLRPAVRCPTQRYNIRIRGQWISLPPIVEPFQRSNQEEKNESSAGKTWARGLWKNFWLMDRGSRIHPF